jgi:hypothetical protein
MRAPRPESGTFIYTNPASNLLALTRTSNYSMRYLFFSFLLICRNLTLHCQPISNEYILFAAKADSALFKGEYETAIDLYKFAFTKNNGIAKVVHRYKLAAAFAQVKLADSAFIQLDRIATKGKFKEYEIIANDFLFLPLREDSRWEAILNKVRFNLTEFEKNKSPKN